MLLLEKARVDRESAMLYYLSTKIAVVESLTGQIVDHGLFADPAAEAPTRGPKAIDDRTLINVLGFVKEG